MASAFKPLIILIALAGAIFCASSPADRTDISSSFCFSKCASSASEIVHNDCSCECHEAPFNPIASPITLGLQNHRNTTVIFIASRYIRPQFADNDFFFKQATTVPHVLVSSAPFRIALRI